MIRLSAKISAEDLGVIDSADLYDYVNSGSSQPAESNNVSKTNFMPKSYRRETNNGFILGADRLDGKTVMIDYASNNFFTGIVLSDEDGRFSSANYLLKIKGSGLSFFNIAFDTLNNRYPTLIYVNDIRYENKSSIFTIKGLDSSEGIQNYNIEFYKWNAPYYPLVISGIYASQTLKKDKEITSFNFKSIDRADLSVASYGLISNRGNINFLDNNGDFENMAKNIPYQNINIEISVNNYLNKNTLEQQKAVVSTLSLEDYQYDSNRRLYNLTLKDFLEEWQNIEISGFETTESMTAYNIFEHLKQQTPPNYKFNELNSETRTNLISIMLPFVKLEKSNLWSAWNKLATLASLQIYVDNKGYVAVHHSV